MLWETERATLIGSLYLGSPYSTQIMQALNRSNSPTSNTEVYLTSKIRGDILIGRYRCILRAIFAVHFLLLSL